ncbi:MAG: TSUP family transporter [Oscillospiraceae bacterium]|nr:TSUP family transporter [Oscillospiraceae bacterium]
MVDSWPVAVTVATILGFLSGLGIGGGSLLILWLTMVLGLPHRIARGINLLFFLPAAVIASLLHRKTGAVVPRRILPAIAAGCTAALLGTAISSALNAQLLQKLFGGLLLLTGIRELCYKPKA